MFAEHGFAGTKLADVAKRAGVAKGTLYLYFDTKEDLFRAAAQRALAVRLDGFGTAATGFDGTIAELLPLLLKRTEEGHTAAILRIVLAESRAFPDLARIWHDEVVARVLSLLTSMIAEAQARGEVRPGDPKLFALSIISPMILGLLFHDMFVIESPFSPNLDALAAQHSEAILRGILVR